MAFSRLLFYITKTLVKHFVELLQNILLECRISIKLTSVWLLIRLYHQNKIVRKLNVVYKDQKRLFIGLIYN